MAQEDLGKVIELIMSHPEIIAEISGLLGTEKKESAPPAEVTPDDRKTEVGVNTSVTEQAQPTVSESKYIPEKGSIRGSQRGELLRALKPYVSPERGKAIESMLTIADILDVMRRK